MFCGDWTATGTKEDLEKQIGNDFVVRSGWTITDTDTVFCERVCGNTFKVVAWNDPNVRDILQTLLNRPVHRENR